MFAAGNPPDVFRLNDDFVLAWKTQNLLAKEDVARSVFPVGFPPLAALMASTAAAKIDVFV